MKNKKLSTFYQPTPAKFRKIGDAMLAASTTITTYAIYNDMKAVAITALIIGTVGKFLSSFFSE
jgi:hypothetical protein